MTRGNRSALRGPPSPEQRLLEHRRQQIKIAERIATANRRREERKARRAQRVLLTVDDLVDLRGTAAWQFTRLTSRIVPWREDDTGHIVTTDTLPAYVPATLLRWTTKAARLFFRREDTGEEFVAWLLAADRRASPMGNFNGLGMGYPVEQTTTTIPQGMLL